MSYMCDIKIDGFDFGIGRIFSYTDYPMQIIFDIDNEKIINAINNMDIEFLKAIKKACSFSGEVDALYNFSNFEENVLRYHKWSVFLRYESYDSLEDYKRQALIVLASKNSDENSKDNARIYLEALKGNVPKYIETEEDIIYRKENRFKKSRAKWLKLLIERDGYKCTKCKIDKDLCVKHMVSLRDKGETELSNLKLFCRKCINTK